MSSPDLYNKRFVLFTGKGGVGKTAMASAFALSCAQRGERTLLIELNVKDKVSSLFGAQHVGTEIVEVDENLYAVNITPAAAMEEYALMILKVKLIYRAVFENRVVRSFLRVIPGLNELVMLGKAYFHVMETNAQGKPVWDKVIIDAPATGHGIFFLQIPSVITSVVGSGLMFDEARRIEELLQDSERTALALVTLPEEMPVNETLMLRDVIRDKLKMPIGCVIANAVYRPLFDDNESAWLDEASKAAEAARAAEAGSVNASLGGLIEAGRFRAGRVRLQQHYIARLEAELDLPMLRVPYYFMDRMSFAIIHEMAADLERQLGPGAPNKSNLTKSVG
ncbi:MAG: ArsA family ATPase [Bradymonadaceae bacterium]|nr:ArsA family ATPase [Lujinxingiaceae bacterium]